MPLLGIERGHTPDVDHVVFGPGGVAEGVQPGSVVVDMSTISPVTTRSVAQRLISQGVEMLDAPVSGGEVRWDSAVLVKIAEEMSGFPARDSGAGTR